MGRVEGKVAFVTGAARGQGRSHALRLAEEGADIVAVDLAELPFPWMNYATASAADLDETVRLVEDRDRRIVARHADVRDRSSLRAAVDEGLAAFGHIDIVCANAGIGPIRPDSWEIPPEEWEAVLGVNLTGVWNTTSVLVPPMIEAGHGGSIVVTSSGAGLKGSRHLADYVSSKFGVIGFAKSLAAEVGRHHIRVNVIAPGNVDTDMIQNEAIYRLFRPDVAEPDRQSMAERCQTMGLIPEPWVEAIDISNAVLWLASDEARYVTGVVLPVDLGISSR